MSDDIEVTARQELNEIAEVLRQASEKEKEFKALKEEVRGPFFELISEIVREEIPLATLVVFVPNEDTFDIRTWAALNYPEYRVISVDAVEDQDGMNITLQENEIFKKFEFNHDGFKYGRTIRMKGAGFDAEGFYKMLGSDLDLDHELALKLAEAVTKQTVVTYEVDEAKALEVMADYPETVVWFQKYQRPGTPEVALLPIRPVKEGEEVE